MLKNKIKKLEFFKHIHIEKYYKLPIRFLVDLQNLHDNNCYWPPSGLSDEGKKYVEFMKDKIKNEYQKN